MFNKRPYVTQSMCDAGLSKLNWPLKPLNPIVNNSLLAVVVLYLYIWILIRFWICVTMSNVLCAAFLVPARRLTSLIKYLFS